MEARLAGKPSGEVRVVDAGGHVVTVLERFDGLAPVPVRTTIDPAVQGAAERALASVPQPAALVAIDAPTGQLRAVVSNPSGGFARALVGRYPPGSTFKVVTATAALRTGITPDTEVQCPPKISVGGRSFTNAENEQFGAIPFSAAFARSCNTAFIGVARNLTQAQLVDAARSYGFGAGDEVDLGLPAYGGSVPDQGDAVEHASDAIGQGKVLVSPLQMASVAATVASGAWQPPHLVADAPPGKPRPLEPAVAAALRDMMRAVVTGGTGTKANVPGAPVSGKTGTAEFGNDVPPKTHAWFIGFRGNLAFAVLVEGAGFGGDVAAPAAARFLSVLPS
jgi:cell division protein FtsI/penicillin-binding protein 2